jgi:hypothetical protein
MSRALSGQAINAEKQGLVSPADLSQYAKSNLTKLAAWISHRNIAFLIAIHGTRYMSNLGLFLFKDVISLVLPNQLFRQESDPFRKQMLLTETEGAVGWHLGSTIRQSRLRSGPATGSRRRRV